MIIISKRGEGAHPDTLRKVKIDPEITNLGNNVSHIRRFQLGDLMLWIKKNIKIKDITAGIFSMQIGKLLEQEGEGLAHRRIL